MQKVEIDKQAEVNRANSKILPVPSCRKIRKKTLKS